MQLLLNVGGPDRVSRVQMAEAVAQFRGYDPSLIKPVSASSVRVMLHSSQKFHEAESILAFCLSLFSLCIYEIINLQYYSLIKY